MPTNGWGNIYCNSFSGDTALASGGGFTGFLDQYPGASLALSYRLLSSLYTGFANELRADVSGQPQQNIGFDNGDYDIVSAQTFLSTADGYQSVWYDQSGNGLNFTQAVAAGQFQIATSGVVNTLNGNAAAETTTVQNLFRTLPTITSGEITMHAVLKHSGNAAQRFLTLGYIFPTTGFTLGATTSFFDNGTETAVPTNIGSTHSVLTIVVNSSGSTVYRNGVQQGTTSNQALFPSNPIFFLNSRNFGADSQMELQEVILYYSDQSANLAGQVTNIKSYYNIP